MMSTATVRLAVIGVGSWANRVHIPQVLSHPQAELVALCARTAEKLRAAGQQFGVERLYTDYRALLDEEELDAVTISSTHNAHYELARAALERGLHVFCEKPLGVDSTQTGELVALAAEKGVKTMVAFTNRWVPEAAYVKRLLDHGYCGEVFHYNACQLAGYGRPGGNWMWRADPELAGGGVLFDLGSHVIDMAQWFVGPIAAVCADLKTTAPERLRDGRLVPTPVDDSDAFLARFASGAQGIFHISWTTVGVRNFRQEIAGRNGTLVLNLFHDVWLNSLSGCTGEEAALHPLAVPDDLQGEIPRAVDTPEEREVAHQAFLTRHPSLVRAFVDCIVQDTEATPSFLDGHQAQLVMDAVLRSYRERRWVEVGP